MSKKYIIFKYSHFNKSSLELLINRQLWFADPGTLNDPFECQMVAKNVFDSIWAHYQFDENKKKKILGDLNMQLEKTGICSFSKAKKNQLMWAHYADEHKGFCIGFDVDKLNLNQNRIDLIPVEYQAQYPYENIVDFLHYYKNDPDKSTVSQIVHHILCAIIQTKYSYWRYEREVRLVIKKYGAKGFAPSAINSITFGLRMSERDSKTLRTLLSGEEWSHIIWYKAYKSKTKYALEFKKI